MPIYEYRCQDCRAIVSRIAAIDDIPAEVDCERCSGLATRIVSLPSVHLSARSKGARLDSKYDKMVDGAMRNSAAADPDRLVNRRGDISKGRPDH